MIMMVGYEEQHHHFIFGYGSLICPKSRKISAPSLSETDAEAIPVLVTNWKRSWSARAPNHDYGWKGQTYMGIQQEEGKCCNGVLIRVNETQLKQLDIREEGYDRVHIDLSEIHDVPTDNEANDINKSFLCTNKNSKNSNKCTHHPILEAAEEQRRRKKSGHEDESCEDKKNDDTTNIIIRYHVWVYWHRDHNLPPNPLFPIIQSYVDIILRGCFSISPQFARLFLMTTEGWWEEEHNNQNHQDHCENHPTWIDDRQTPIYVRADRAYSHTNGQMLDIFIQEHIPNALNHRQTFNTPNERPMDSY